MAQVAAGGAHLVRADACGVSFSPDRWGCGDARPAPRATEDLAPTDPGGRPFLHSLRLHHRARAPRYASRALHDRRPGLVGVVADGLVPVGLAVHPRLAVVRTRTGDLPAELSNTRQPVPAHEHR